MALALSCGASARAPEPPPSHAKKEKADRSGPTPAPAQASPGATVTWKIMVTKELTIDERVCWSGIDARRVIPEMPSAIRFAKAAAEDGSAIAMDHHGAPVSGMNGCITLAMDLKRAASELADEAALTKSGDAVYGSLDIWLWRPEPWPEGLRGKLAIETAPEVAVSLPFARDEQGTYVVPYSAWKMMARAAIGKLSLDTIEHDILRKQWRDPRVHYAVNCASFSCPNLAARAWKARQLEEMLDEGARAYVNHPRGVKVT